MHTGKRHRIIHKIPMIMDLCIIADPTPMPIGKTTNNSKESNTAYPVIDDFV